MERRIRVFPHLRSCPRTQLLRGSTSRPPRTRRSGARWPTMRGTQTWHFCWETNPLVHTGMCVNATWREEGKGRGGEGRGGDVWIKEWMQTQSARADSHLCFVHPFKWHVFCNWHFICTYKHHTHTVYIILYYTWWQYNYTESQNGIEIHCYMQCLRPTV